MNDVVHVAIEVILLFEYPIEPSKSRKVWPEQNNFSWINNIVTEVLNQCKLQLLFLLERLRLLKRS